jgi:ATP-dependent protease Clp ATPase subunit
VPLHPLSEHDLVRIIQEPEDSLLSQVIFPLFYLTLEYQRLFSLNQVILQFTSGAIRQVAKRCMSTTNGGPTDGARGLRRVMEEVLEGPQVSELITWS